MREHVQVYGNDVEELLHEINNKCRKHEGGGSNYSLPLSGSLRERVLPDVVYDWLRKNAWDGKPVTEIPVKDVSPAGHTLSEVADVIQQGGTVRREKWAEGSCLRMLAKDDSRIVLTRLHSLGGSKLWCPSAEELLATDYMVTDDIIEDPIIN